VIVYSVQVLHDIRMDIGQQRHLSMGLWDMLPNQHARSYLRTGTLRLGSNAMVSRDEITNTMCKSQ